MEIKKEILVLPEALETFRCYLLEKECATETIRKYCYDVGLFLKYLDNRILTKDHLLQFKKWLAENYAVSSVNSMLAALNQFLECMGLDHWKLRRLRVQRQSFLHQSREMTQEDYQKLLRRVQKENRIQLALIMETMAGTGARVGELSSFTVEQIQKGQIEICHKGKCRNILLPKCLRVKLLIYAGKQRIQKGPVFITRGGKPKDRSNIWAEMKALGKRTGICPEKIFPHNLRHLFARSYYQLTKDISGLASLLGHSSLEVTKIYTANSIGVYQGFLDHLGFELQKNTT